MTASNGPSHAKPISWPASEYWDGADGNWSSFPLRVGSSNPEQIVRVLPSTSGQALWVVSPGGCPSSERERFPSGTCKNSRGGLFNTSDSTSWSSIGNYSLGFSETMGSSDFAMYGTDTIAFGFSKAMGGPYLDSQVVAAFETNDYYLGLFGLGHVGINSSDYSTPNATFLTTLKERDMIPSLSWGYTAGAIYHRGAFGSLTLGGYDSSRLVPNNVSFALAPDISGDLTVSLNSIAAKYENDSVAWLLSEPILTFIDSTTPDIYLPLDVCREFEKMFGLVWNTTYQKYFVDDDQHGILMAEDSHITLQLATNSTGGPTVDILLPYASFDLAMDYPLVPRNLSGIRYFPLKRATDPSQYTLGRTFLQEAYIITNYEQSNFSVFQSRFEAGVKSNIVPISSADTESHTSDNAKIDTKIGLSVGVIAFFLLSLIAAIFFVKKKKRRLHQGGERNYETADLTEPRQHSAREIAPNSLIIPYRELPDSGKAELLDSAKPSGSGNQVLELSAPAAPVSHDLVDPSFLAVHELMPYHALDGRPMAQTHASRSKQAILVSNHMSRQSRPSIGTSTERPCVETTICSQKLQTVDVDRSLPTTPISESPQISPIVLNFGGAVTARKGPDAFVERSAAVESVCGIMGQIPSSPNQLNAWQRRFAHLSYTSMDMEIVVPPGPSEFEIIQPLNVSKKSEKCGNYF